MKEQVSLRPYNTFGMDVPAEYFMELDNPNSLREIADLRLPLHIIGSGSNILLTSALKGLVLLNKCKGIETLKEDENNIWLKVASGEQWHAFVMYAVDKGYGGIENMALIPGTVGAAPIQNIGAYGIEAKDTIETVTCWHWADKCFKNFTNPECKFGYRDSIFKQQLQGQVFITSVVFKLSKKPILNTSYGAIEDELARMKVSDRSVMDVAQAVINIRTSKLPDPAQIGNAGSFFKNPTLPILQYKSLVNSHPGIPSYPVNANFVKVPAGWLIEFCGWKGFRRKDVGVHAQQALVLVNYGHATGVEIWQLSVDIVRSVREKFGIELEREVNLW